MQRASAKITPPTRSSGSSRNSPRRSRRRRRVSRSSASTPAATRDCSRSTQFLRGFSTRLQQSSLWDGRRWGLWKLGGSWADRFCKEDPSKYFFRSGGGCGLTTYWRGCRIWSVRKLLDLYYNNRIGNAESKLDHLQKKQRDTIEQLKAATNFSTTQSIIEKYGGGFISTDADKKKLNGSQTPPGHPNGNRQPPPTTPQQVQQQLIQQQLMAQQRSAEQRQTSPSANPNPVQKSTPPPTIPVLNLPDTTTQPSSQQHIEPEEATASRWYDRLLDVLVGEDETSAKNRYALICDSCRMVNGLAPPGTRSLEEMDGWGCARCGAMNGQAVSRSPSMASSRPSSRPPSSVGDELVPEVELRKGRKAKTPVPNENIRTTRSKVKEEVVEEGTEEESAEESSSEEDDEEIPETPKPKSNTRVTRGRKKA